MFCVECGKEDTIFKDGLCIHCYVQSQTFTQGPLVLNITWCPKCDGYKFKNLWHNESIQETILREIKEQFTISPDINTVTYHLTCEPEDTQFECNLIIKGTIADQQISEHHTLQIRLTKTVCDVCSKQYGGYYEGILQIRATDRTLTDPELDTIDIEITDMITTEQNKGNRGLFVTDIVEEHGGLDYYLSERGMAYTIAKKLKSNHGGDIKQTSSLVGMKEGRELTRITVLLRLPPYKQHDFIKYHDHFYQIDHLTGTKITLLNLATWEETTIPEKDLKKIIVYPKKDYQQTMIVVSQTPTEIQVMHPTTYTTYDLNKPKPLTIESETIETVRLHDTLFIIPKKEKKMRKRRL